LNLIYKTFLLIEAVQQSKIGRIRKADNALNQKRRNIFGVKTNCETASIVKTYICKKIMTKTLAEIINLCAGWTPNT
jgi:hypothetical protein